MDGISEFLLPPPGKTFPRITINDYSNESPTSGKDFFPKQSLPKSKYSSTETEASSEDDDFSYNRHRKDSTGMMTLSGFSTSASSSSSSRHGRKRRKRRHQSTEKFFHNESRNELTSSFNSYRSFGSSRSRRSSLNSGVSGSRRLHLPILNSVNDLVHATGRHRGISGSLAPAIDSVLFAMFYATDIFDYLFNDEGMLRHRATGHSINIQIYEDILGVLRKEIIYSLRTSYFCPAGKIMKLVRLLEENYPLDGIQDPASFIDLLFSAVANNQPAFLTYTNGSSRHLVKLCLKEQVYLTRNNYYHRVEPLVFTIQSLLQAHFNRGSSDFSGGVGPGLMKFVTVPYPALIIQIKREYSESCQVYYDNGVKVSGSASHCEHHHKHYPVLPNMVVDLTSFISQNYQQHGKSWESLSNSFMVPTLASASCASRNSLDGEWRDEKGQMIVGKSRLMKGLKSAWNTMFRYLEDFASSPSTHFPSENLFVGNYNDSYGSPASASSSIQSSFFPRSNDNHYHHSSCSQTQSPSIPSSSSPLSFMSSSPHPRRCTENYFFQENTPSTYLGSSSRKSIKRGEQAAVKMELIAVICKSDGYVCGCNNNGINKSWGNDASKSKGFTGYSVYCKAGAEARNIFRDNENLGNVYAPWILYQSRSGVAPQVTLIENFGKWISSLERNQDDLSLHHVPLEIRRVLEDSELLIYKRIENLDNKKF